MATAAAQRDGLQIAFRQSGAEDLPFEDNAFDVVTANQCWLYFDLKKTIPEVLRVLDAGGLLVVSYFSFLPRLDRIVRASESLVLKHNPDWSGADWDRTLPGLCSSFAGMSDSVTMSSTNGASGYDLRWS